MHDIRIATAIFNSPLGEIKRNLEHMVSFIKEAGKKNAKIICFPELCITGYGNGQPIIEKAVSVGGDIVELLTSQSEIHDMTILCGLAEKSQDDLIYATHLIIKPDRSVHKYHKLHLAPPEQSTFTAGNDIPVFESHGLIFGVQMCYDAHFPELSTKMAVMGADAIFIPHASPRGTSSEKFDSWMRHLTARAFDNGVYIIAVNQCGDNGNGLTFPGLSVVITPSGEIQEKNISDSENLLVVDLLQKDLDLVRGHRMRYFLPNRRPDLY